MEFEFLNPELWGTATTIMKHYRMQRYKVFKEQEIDKDLSYRPTILCKKRDLYVAIEVESEIKLSDSFLDFVKEATLRRLPLKIYIGVPVFTETETSLTLETERIMKQCKIGLITIEKTKVIFEKEAVNLAMFYKTPPGPSLEQYATKVSDAVDKNNSGKHLDGLRDVTELVEDVVNKIFEKAVKKKVINVELHKIDKYDFEKRINCLSQAEWNGVSQKKHFDKNMERDLKSFKGARIKAHHPRDYHTNRRLMNQCIERIEMGIRLLREAIAIIRKI